MLNVLGQLFGLIFVHPTVNGLVAIYKLLSFVHVPYALGFSIIVFTVIIRLILYPLTSQQLKTTKKLQDLNPHLKKLKDKHKNDAKRLQAETMSLYKEHGVNPMSGCLPTLIQFLLFPALYSVFNDFVNVKTAHTIAKFNSIVYLDALKLKSLGDPTFFGIQLGQSPSHLIATMGPVILLVPVITGLLQFFQSKMMFTKPQEEVIKDKNKKAEPDFASTMQTQMIYLLPFTIGFAAFNFPFGLALYWNTFTVFAIIQQYLLHGWGGLAEWKDRFLPQKAQISSKQKK